MTDAEEKAKAEKLVAAKKRVAQLQKQKAKKAVEKKKDDTDTATNDQSAEGKEADRIERDPTPSEPQEAEGPPDHEADEPTETPSKTSHGRQPSLSLQSKMRSSSFRRTSLSMQNADSPVAVAKSPTLPPLSPEGDTMPDIYRKQMTRVEELERENRRLEKVAAEGNSRWRKAEEELEDLREGSGEAMELKARAQRAEKKVEDIEKLKLDIVSLQRQNTQLQNTKTFRSSNAPSGADSSPESLTQLLASKSDTIEMMELEISNLRTQLSTQSTECQAHSSQISALEQKAGRAEFSLDKAQRELADAKRSLSRAAEKAMKEGVDKTSSDTKMKSLERGAQEASLARVEAEKRIDTLEKKLAALNTLQKENEARTMTKLKETEHIERDAERLRKRAAGMENENMRLREERDRHRKREISAPGEDGLDELEDEERLRLEKKVRELEGEVFDLRRGVWKERKKEVSERHEDDEAVKTPGSTFDEVDLTGGLSPPRRRSSAGRQVQSFSNVLTSGWGALTGGTGVAQGSLEPYDDGDDNFNEDAFRIAQEEEEARQRVEWVREQKRKLRDWEGWRVDLVELRKGVAGAGELFDI